MVRATGMSFLDTGTLGATWGLWLCDFCWYEILGALGQLSWEQQGCQKEWFPPDINRVQKQEQGRNCLSSPGRQSPAEP